MDENKTLALRIPLKQKIALLIFGLSLCLLLLETGLRLGGFILFSLQEHRNRVSIQQKGAYRILCLGESTTARQWPPFLEEILNQRNIGIKFSVIDRGVPGQRSSTILAELGSNLDEYHPDMVVAMMGINDRNANVPYEAVSTSKAILFLGSLRIYKLTRLVWLHIVTKLQETGFYKLMIKRKTPDRLDYSLIKTGLKESRADETDSLLSDEPFKKAIEINADKDRAHTGLGYLYRDQKEFSQPEELFKKVIELDHRWDERRWLLYQDMGEAEMAKAYKKKAEVSLRLNYYNSITINNYRKIKEILDKRGIRLVCVQYPVRSVEPLKRIFQGKEGVIFVDNEKVFMDVLRATNYQDYFVDMFGGQFGHCTPEGNRLLAGNIANVILKEVFGK